jgi:ABC-2 type transport system permease protein
MIRLLLAFLRRDWMRRASYRLLVVWQLAGMVGFLTVLYVSGGALAAAARSHGLGDDYIAFILAGLAFTDLFLTSMQTFSGTVREAQLQGTLEPMLLAPLRVPELVAGSILFPFAQSLFRTIIAISVAFFAFGLFHHANPVSALLVLIPGIIVFASIGVLSASFVLAFKQGDPVIGMFAFVSSIVGGSVFPPSLLPNWVRSAGVVLPLTNALAGMRLALAGASPLGVLPQVGALWLTTLVLLPIAGLAFNAALRHAKREGSLVQY